MIPKGEERQMLKNVVVLVMAVLVAAVVPGPAAAQGCPIAVAASVDGWFDRQGGATVFQEALETALRNRGATVIPVSGHGASAAFHGRPPANACTVVIANVSTESGSHWLGFDQLFMYGTATLGTKTGLAFIKVPNNQYSKMAGLAIIAIALAAQIY